MAEATQRKSRANVQEIRTKIESKIEIKVEVNADEAELAREIQDTIIPLMRQIKQQGEDDRKIKLEELAHEFALRRLPSS